MARGLIVGIGAAGALVAAVTGYYISGIQGGGDAPLSGVAAPERECIAARVKLVEGMTRSCMTPAQFESFRDRPVIGGSGEPIAVNLTSPDAESGVIAVRTCAEYDSMIGDGWFALTSAEMKRAEFFERACGALSLLAGGRPAKVSNFADGAATESEIRSLAEADAIAFGETGPSAPVGIESVGDSVWRIAIGQGETLIYEIAHADFTGDGLGEILAYLTTGAAGGAVRAGTIGLIEKPSASGPCTFIPR